MTADVRRSSVWVVAAALAALFGSGTVLLEPAAASRLDDTIVVTIDPPTGSVVLGEKLDLVVTATNNGPDETPPLVIHLDITDPAQTSSVDPEDWTPTLSQSIGPLAPGQTISVDWTIQPISSGTFATYAVALASGADTVAASNVLDVQVEHQRTLNPGGILPVAIAAPGLVGALLVVQLRLARRTGSAAPEPSFG